MNIEHLEPYNKKLLVKVLGRIEANNKTSFKITNKNRELLRKYYKHMVNEGIAITRQRLVLGVLGRLLEMLNKDFETSTKEDIEELVTKIREKNISPVTQSDYLKKIKQFDKWVNGGEEPSARTKRIKTGIGKKHYKLPSQLVTPKEAEELINATDNTRDRALIHLMWESGARIGEIINCRMNSIQFDNGEARIRMYGKVGERQVLLLESVRDLKEYVKTRNNAKPDEPLFVLLGCAWLISKRTGSASFNALTLCCGSCVFASSVFCSINVCLALLSGNIAHVSPLPQPSNCIYPFGK